jgi:hypothetical protein
MLRELLRGAPRSVLAAVGLALFVASPLSGQAVNGKVQGRVTDAATGAPISGAQVRIENTTLGNLTNDQGFYFINEVPAGLQNIEGSFIGYRSVVVEGERILAGQTTTINFELEQTAVELEAITVEGERNPLVPRDQTSTKAIIQGDAVDQLPLDNASDVVTYSPGVVQTNSGRTIRGSRTNEEAVLVDGVLTRQFGTGTANNVDLPTNALEQVDVNIGAFSAEFGQAQSGVVSYVTRSGAAAFTGSLEYQTDQLAPDNWRTNFNRGEFTFGGPLFGNLSFFLAGTLQGQERNFTEEAPTRYVIDGYDVCPEGGAIGAFCAANGLAAGDTATFLLEQGSAANGATDYLALTAPRFKAVDNGRVQPFGTTQTDLFTGNINWQLPRGSRLNFAYTRNRNQNYGRTLGGLNNFNSADISGGLNIEQVFTLGGYFNLIQSADQQLALDLRASYQTDRAQNGQVDFDWYADNRDPFLGFAFSNVDFELANLYGDNPTITGFDWFDPGEDLINAYRSGGIPRDSMAAYPQREDLDLSQSLGSPTTGGGDPLRYNPYGWNTNYSFVGVADGNGWNKTSEDRIQFRGSLDWQIGRFNRLKIGGEYMSVDLANNGITLYSFQPLPEEAEPILAGAFIQDRLDIGDLVLEAGLRLDYLDPDTEYPRVPGFTFNVPDSLTKGFVRWDEDTQAYVPIGCDVDGGPCVDNFIAAKTKTEWSPRLGASFPVTPTSTFRLSYGKFTQVPPFFTSGGFSRGLAGVSGRGIGVFSNSNTDFLSGQNSNAAFGRDVDMPTTRTFEFGYRQLVGQDFVIDVSAFNKKQRKALTLRKYNFPEPITGAPTGLLVLTNSDFTELNGFEVRLDKAFGRIFNGNLSYSYIDARGTGSDPFTYSGLILRATSGLETLTGEVTLPPEALLTLDQSRKHTIGLTTSLLFPRDYQEGTFAGALLQDFGFYSVLYVRSGLPYTKLENAGGTTTGPPSGAGLSGLLDSEINGLSTDWVTSFDVRFTKGFQLGRNLNLQAFVDWRNPLNLTNSTSVFLETASSVNELARERYLQGALTDSRLDGDTDIDSFDIARETPAPDNAFNAFMLLRAEERFGNGDGIFTVEEQNRAFGQRWEDNFGQNVRFERSDQSLRLGLRLAF